MKAFVRLVRGVAASSSLATAAMVLVDSAASGVKVGISAARIFVAATEWCGALEPTRAAIGASAAQSARLASRRFGRTKARGRLWWLRRRGSGDWC